MVASPVPIVERARSGVLTFWLVCGGLLLCFVCTGIGMYVFSGPELTREGMTGVWRSKTGAVIRLEEDFTLQISDMPGDLWSGDLSQKHRVEVRGIWRLCGKPEYRHGGSDCGPPSNGVYVAMKIVYDAVWIDGEEVDDTGEVTWIEVTDESDGLVLRFNAPVDFPYDTRHAFVKAGT